MISDFGFRIWRTQACIGTRILKTDSVEAKCREAHAQKSEIRAERSETAAGGGGANQKS